LLKQAAKPSRRWQDEFHRFHGDEIARMRAELRGDVEFDRALWLCSILLRDRPERRPTSSGAELGSSTGSGRGSSPPVG
jgi:hypothetical protein